MFTYILSIIFIYLLKVSEGHGDKIRNLNELRSIMKRFEFIHSIPLIDIYDFLRALPRGTADLRWI